MSTYGQCAQRLPLNEPAQGHWCIRADDGQAGEAIGQVHFDVDGGRFHAGKGTAS